MRLFHRAARALGFAAVVTGAIFVGPAAPAGGARPPRAMIDATEYPWRAFGRVNRQGRGFCTGVLIAPEIVLTAAHCLYDTKRRAWVEPRFMHFVAAYQKGRFLFDAKVARFEIGKGYEPGGERRSSIESASDWAILHLARAAGPEVGYLGVARLRPGDALAPKPVFTLAGYGRDRPYALSAHRNCALLRWDGAAPLVHHDCRAEHGTSGAPIIRRLGRDYVVVALHVGRGELGSREIGAAVPSGVFFEAALEATGRRARRSPGLGLFMAGSRAK